VSVLPVALLVPVRGTFVDDRHRMALNCNLEIRSSIVRASGPVQISPRPRVCYCPLFMSVRNPRESFTPVAPSMAPISRMVLLTGSLAVDRPLIKPDISQVGADRGASHALWPVAAVGRWPLLSLSPLPQPDSGAAGICGVTR
jgi:hypothetical protein